MTPSHLAAEPGVVYAAGESTAGMSGAWQEWATSVSTGFGDAQSVVRNAHFSSAIAEHSGQWNPVAQRVSSRVTNLGAVVAEAAVTVHDADTESAHLLTTQTVVAAEHGSVLNRPVNL